MGLKCVFVHCWSALRHVRFDLDLAFQPPSLTPPPLPLFRFSILPFCLISIPHLTPIHSTPLGGWGGSYQPSPHSALNASTIHSVRHECIRSNSTSMCTTPLRSAGSLISGPQIKTVWQSTINSCGLPMEEKQAAQMARAWIRISS